MALEVSAGLTSLGEVFTQFITWIGSLVTTIASQPLLLLSVGIMCVAAVIGLAHKLVRG